MEWKGSVRGADQCLPLAGVDVVARDAGLNELGRAQSNAAGEWELTTSQQPRDFRFSHRGFDDKIVASSSLKETTRLLESSLVGYYDKLWFYPGESLAARVYSPQDFQSRLFRHGIRREEVLDLGTTGRTIQEIPDDWFVETGVNWDETLRYQIPPDARPGLYSLNCKSDSDEFAIPMIVSTPPEQRGVTSKLLVVASTTTWQAYNFWGGRNLYRSCEDCLPVDVPLSRPSRALRFKSKLKANLPQPILGLLRRMLGKEATPSEPEWRFQRLSGLRPCTNAALEQTDPLLPFMNHLAAGEWRLLAWLEKQAIPYDIVSCHELHLDPNLLQNYRAVLLNTHSEYWSRKMYKGLRKFHLEQRGWLLNISGNSIFREVELDAEGGLRCVGMSFAETCADETEILCVRHTDSDNGSCAPFRILRPEHWAFANAPLAADLVFGKRSLNQNTRDQKVHFDAARLGLREFLDGEGASGWETDKRSRTAPKDAIVIAKGQNPFGGADMVIREPGDTRGGLFSASSITFSGSLLIDDVASTLVQNVIHRALHE